MNFKTALFLSKFRWRNLGFAYQIDEVGGFNVRFIRKMILFLDLFGYTWSWRVKATSIRIK